MKYWILKTEPGTYSFADLMKDKKTCWDGVRNYQARNNLRSMDVGDQAIIYHSGDDKAAVGLAKVISPGYKDPKSDEDWTVVDLEVVSSFATSISLSEMKKDQILKEMALVKQSRLSVCPLTKVQFDRLVKLSKADL